MKKWIKVLIIVACVIVGLFVFFLLTKKEPEFKSINQGVIANIKKLVDTSNWIEYSNSQLGFSIKIPPESYGMYGCLPRKTISVPVKIYEDINNNAVYIAEEYYYDTNKEGKCEKIMQSIELFKKAEKEANVIYFSNSKPFLGWKIVIGNVKDREDILKYIKENFGSECVIQNEFLKENGNHEFYLMGEGKKEEGDPWYGGCSLGFAYKIIYSPNKNKIMSVSLGQEGTFQTNPEEPSTYQFYEEEMLKSFKFE